jgi:ribosomal protein L37E
MSGNYRKEKNCLNCGHHVEEHYCSHCGQPNLELKEPLWGFMAHSVGHYFHFDSKFFHTLVPLLTKPGQITLDYLAGKRARYIHPVSLYIFVSIIYFLIVPHAIEKREHDAKAKKAVSEIKRGSSGFSASRQDSTYASYLLRQQQLPEAERDNWFEKQARKIQLNSEGPADQVNIKSELKKYQPKQYFLFMPLLAFFIMLNFRKNHIYYIDHLVFTVHGTTAFFIISIIAEPLRAYVFGPNTVMGAIIETAVFIGIVWYLYKGLKLFYQRSRAVIIRKMITLIILYGIALWISEWILIFLISTVIL